MLRQETVLMLLYHKLPYVINLLALLVLQFIQCMISSCEGWHNVNFVIFYLIRMKKIVLKFFKKGFFSSIFLCFYFYFYFISFVLSLLFLIFFGLEIYFFNLGNSEDSVFYCQYIPWNMILAFIDYFHFIIFTLLDLIF